MKSNKLFLLFLFFILSNFLIIDYVISQDSINSKTPELIQYRKGDKWGYCNKDKEIIILCRYDDVNMFSEGFAKVELNNKFGYVDKEGREVVS